MSIETLDQIVARDLVERRRSRLYFLGLASAILVILVAMVTAM